MLSTRIAQIPSSRANMPRSSAGEIRTGGVGAASLRLICGVLLGVRSASKRSAEPDRERHPLPTLGVDAKLQARSDRQRQNGVKTRIRRNSHKALGKL
jgi:hypothetical protein